MVDYIRIGVLTSTHGVKGEIKVYPTTDYVEQYEDLTRVFIDLASGKNSIRGEGLLELEMEKARFTKDLVIVKFKGIDDIDAVAKYKGKDLLIAREDAVPLEEGQVFIADLIGCQVYDEDGSCLGETTEVLETAANDVLVVKRPAENKPAEVCIPYIPDCILNVDVEEKRIDVHLLPGLL